MLLNRVPYPLNDGGAICSYYAVKGYVDAGCEVTCLAINTSKHYVDLSKTGTAFSGVKDLQTVALDNRIKPLAALVNLLGSKSYVVDRFQSEEYERKLTEILQAQTYDVVHVDNLPSCLYIDTVRRYSKAPIVYRAHNVEYNIWSRAAEADTNPLKKIYLRIQAERLRKFELVSLQKADMVLPISKDDEAFIKEVIPGKKTVVFPAGIDIDERHTLDPPAEVSLFFIGALDWLPNLQGLDWFLHEVWPQVHAAFPDMKFHLAGKKMPQRFYNYASQNVVAYGEVPSASEFMAQHSVLLSPALSGSGVRIKIIEAMAAGKVILSTTIAAEGSGTEDSKNILIADTAADYVRQILRLIQEPDLLVSISKNARDFALGNFQNKTLIAGLLDQYRLLCS